MTSPSREVHCADALEWLSARAPLAGCSIVTSLPDVSETGRTLDAWIRWFADAAERLLTACPPDGVAIFFQTDIKVRGRWVDKGHLIQTAADRAGARLLWHRIACRLPPDTPGPGRPGYAHVLCFTRGVQDAPPTPMPDVLADSGEKLWARGIGFLACAHMIVYVRRATRSNTVLDPFCGRGTTLAVANAAGLNAIGVDLSPACCRRSRALAEVPEKARRLLRRESGPGFPLVAGPDRADSDR